TARQLRALLSLTNLRCAPLHLFGALRLAQLAQDPGTCAEHGSELGLLQRQLSEDVDRLLEDRHGVLERAAVLVRAPKLAQREGELEARARRAPALGDVREDVLGLVELPVLQENRAVGRGTVQAVGIVRTERGRVEGQRLGEDLLGLDVGSSPNER